jgi:hypothetical protein
MIGYSDSGKDAGRMAAAWALFETQEKIVKVWGLCVWFGGFFWGGGLGVLGCFRGFWGGFWGEGALFEAQEKIVKVGV